MSLTLLTRLVPLLAEAVVPEGEDMAAAEEGAAEARAGEAGDPVGTCFLRGTW